MGKKLRLICVACDRELPEINAAPGEVANIRYVNQPHRGCGKLDPMLLKKGEPQPSVRALDGTGLVERPAPLF